jgi:hypothetical protein
MGREGMEDWQGQRRYALDDVWQCIEAEQLQLVDDDSDAMTQGGPATIAIDAKRFETRPEDVQLLMDE